MRMNVYAALCGPTIDKIWIYNDFNFIQINKHEKHMKIKYYKMLKIEAIKNKMLIKYEPWFNA